MKITTLVFLSSLLIILFIFSSGLFRGLHHASRDYHNESAIASLLPKDYYDGTGGEERWNQGYVWSSDFTHLCMHFQVLFLLGAGAIFLWKNRIFESLISLYSYRAWNAFYYSPIGRLVRHKNAYTLQDRLALLFALLFVWLGWFIEGRGFSLTYHVLLPTGNVRSITFVQWLIDFIPFI